ncbi:MAG: hypothetical protein H0X45_16200, partial [Planctomycetes bacterium]|nr:hypothetical protein [Planctomycetota bacterium]
MSRRVMLHVTSARGGAVLIIVAGLCGLMAALSIAFLARMRTDATEMGVVVRDAQAKLMLSAACAYVLEAGRIGWDDSPAHRECFGWIDVRDGTTGPKFDASGTDDDRFFRVGSHARFPMGVLRRPPYAVQLTVAYNPIQTMPLGAALPWPAPYGRPYLTEPD